MPSGEIRIVKKIVVQLLVLSVTLVIKRQLSAKQVEIVGKVDDPSEVSP